MALTKVSTDGVKDDAITKAKIPANQIEASELASEAVTNAKLQTNSVDDRVLANNSVVTGVINNGAVTTNKIGDEQVTLAKLPHGDSNNDGKFLRANDGADPSFETVPSSAKNLLTNGSMLVNQRRSTGNLDYYNPVTSSIYTLDRWRVQLSGGFDTDSAHIHQSSTAPTQHGFSKSLFVEIGNTETPSSGQMAGIQQRIEGQNLQRLAYGTSSAKTLTLSFWVRSVRTGTYSVQLIKLKSGSSDKYVLYSYTISSANTWEKKTITISPDTSDAIQDDNSIGFYITWWLCAHSDVTTSATSSWTNGGGYKAVTNQVNLWDSGSNEWYLTGCQLEIGSESTDYDHESFGDTLVKCRRYFWKSFNYGTKRYRNQGNSDSIFCAVVSGYNGGYHFKNQMRTAPTLTFYNPSADNSNSTSLGGCSHNRSTDNMISVEIGCVAGNHYTELDADAEL
tara:strand:+ start:1482 stop:2834 length:1353 start_codon:yes stop_codon:yes gene_type:complete